MRSGFFTLFVSILTLPLFAQDWPQFRGPNHDGSAQGELPQTWGDDENILWKAPLQGKGSSTPIVIGGRVFLTSGVGDSTNLARHVLCFDLATGKVLWDKTVKSELPEQERIREDHGYCSSTPAATKDRLFVFFGKSGVFCFDHAGKQLWNTKVGTGLNGWGSAASLTLHGKNVLVNACVESESLLALDQATGKEVWRAPGIQECWHAPALSLGKDGGEVIMGMMPANKGGQVVAFNVLTGKETWRCKSGISWYICPQPIVHEGVVYSVGGRSGVGGLAVKLGGKGDVTETHRLWTVNQGTNVPTPVIHDGHMYFAHDVKGEAHCVNLKTGEFAYSEPLQPRMEGIYASALLVKDRILYLSRGGQAVFVAAKPKFEALGEARLENGRGMFNASPVLIGNRLLLRSNKFLYCIGEK